MATAATSTYTDQKLLPAFDAANCVELEVKLPASITYARGTVLGEKIGTNSKQRVAITGAPTGGTFTITFGAATTAAIAYGASREVVQTALEAISTIGNGNVLVTGGWNSQGAVFDLEFRGALANAAQSAVTCSVASLTGGVPAETVTSLQTGAAGSPGTYTAYAETSTDGSNVAKAILAYDVSTDANSNITLTATSGQSGNEWGQTFLTIGAYIRGYFNTQDLNVGGVASGTTGYLPIDAKAISDLGKLIQGVAPAVSANAPVGTGILRVG